MLLIYLEIPESRFLAHSVFYVVLNAIDSLFFVDSHIMLIGPCQKDICVLGPSYMIAHLPFKKMPQTKPKFLF